MPSISSQAAVLQADPTGASGSANGAESNTTLIATIIAMMVLAAGMLATIVAVLLRRRAADVASSHDACTMPSVADSDVDARPSEASPEQDVRQHVIRDEP